MPPEPSLAGVAAAPAPGPLERLLRFARASVEATFTPLRFLRRWEAEPARYPDASELLALNAALVALATWLAHEFLDPAGGPSTLGVVAGTSRWAGRLAGGLEAIVPATFVYAQVVSTWLAGRALAGRADWAPARRIAAFLSAMYLPVTVASLLVVFAWPGSTAPIAAASLAVDLGYGALGFAVVHGLRAGRASGASALTVLATLLFQGLFFALAGAAIGFVAVAAP